MSQTIQIVIMRRRWNPGRLICINFLVVVICRLVVDEDDNVKSCGVCFSDRTRHAIRDTC